MLLQGQWKWSSYSSFGQTSFSQGKSEIPFLQKAINKSAIAILGLVNLIILSHNRKVHQEVQDYWMPTHSIIIVLIGYSVVQKS